MNKIISSSGLSLCIGAALLLASCNDQEVKVNSVNVNVTEALSPERSDSVRVNVNAEYPVDGLVDSVKNSICEIIVESTFGSDYSGLSVEDAANRWAGDFVAEYKKANLELLSEAQGDEANDMGAGFFSWENKMEGYFSGKHDNIITYTVSNYVFEGGAHGSTVESSVNIDLKTGKQVTEEDFFIPGYKEALSALLSAHLHDEMPDQESYDALFIKDLEPNGNFKVSEQGVTYVYGQYEIGPYYLGIIKVTIPWNELGDLVREHPTK